MCMWLAIETINYFLRNGSEVFVGIMDMTKAFDNVKQCTLLETRGQRHTSNLPSPSAKHIHKTASECKLE